MYLIKIIIKSWVLSQIILNQIMFDLYIGSVLDFFQSILYLDLYLTNKAGIPVKYLLHRYFCCILYLYLRYKNMRRYLNKSSSANIILIFQHIAKLHQKWAMSVNTKEYLVIFFLPKCCSMQPNSLWTAILIFESVICSIKQLN